jgi:hypothetical protein
MIKFLKKQGLLIAIITLAASFFPASLFAQDDNLPCDAGNPFSGPCPLDTWVVVLAVIAVTFAAIHLKRKQKKALQTQKVK